MWILRNRRFFIGFFACLCICSITALPYLKFSFDFERFFPDGDPDLDYYKEFVEEFESDDNYLLIALANSPSVFDTEFLKKTKDFTNEVGGLGSVESALSISSLQKPQIGFFGIDFSPIFEIDNPNLERVYDSLSINQASLRSLISPDKSSLVVALKIQEHLDIDASSELISGITSLIENYDFEKYHLLGRAYFQNELARLQITEVLYSSIFSVIVVSIILFVLYRNKYLIFITLLSITIGLLFFMALLSILGRELDAISALYPVLMLIVGTSDVIHILSKYLDEIRKGNLVGNAIDTTIRQIGLATFFTSATTAIGFVSLITSRIGPVRDFGVNAAIGVLVAYVTIIFFTTSLLTYFSPEKLQANVRTFNLWDKVAQWFYRISKFHVGITMLSLIMLFVSAIGIFRISTDYNIESSLPKGKKVTEDFLYFEQNFSGYRPLEYVLTKMDGTDIIESEGLRNIRELTEFIRSHPEITEVSSLATILDYLSGFLPVSLDSISLGRAKPILMAALSASPKILINEKGDKARISAVIKDIGAYRNKEFVNEIKYWARAKIDSTVYDLAYTGTGLIIDKNAQYVRESLLKGLGFALLIIGVLMGLLFRSLKMVFISLIPNAIPLVIAGAILGFSGVALEPLTSITFVVIFGIAVDDTIHFLSKFRLALHSGLSVEESIKLSFEESGKAILFTTVVLFFGFMIMLFSYNPASVIVGGLISLTLFTAVFADLILLPVLLRFWYKD